MIQNRNKEPFTHGACGLIAESLPGVGPPRWLMPDGDGLGFTGEGEGVED